MPKTNKSGEPISDELPSTLQRSKSKAQKTFAKTYDSAIEAYEGDERRAHQVAFASLKHTHEKVGDHWEPKEEYGPSDARAEERGPDSDTPTAGGSTPTPPRSTCTNSPPGCRSRAGPR
jgi:cation transport regulator ChaB